MTAWINFKELRAKLSFEQVLRHYGVEVKRKGNQHQGFCPLPNHVGKRNSPSFSANLERGIFQCFGCGAKGNLLEFASLMDKVDPKNGAALRDVALELQQRFCPELQDLSKEAKRNSEQKPAPPEKSAPESKAPVVVNEPLDFELKGLDAGHPYLRERGFSLETIAHFGLGFCSRGFLKDRIAIPLNDHDGRLVGYCGRVVDDKTINEDNPRYRFPGKRERAGTVLEFRKSLFLYNGFRIKAPADDLIIVEGFTSVWWLWQSGFRNVVGLMGASCSPEQADIIVSLASPCGRVWIVTDGDEAGERCALSVLSKVTPHRFSRWPKLRAGQQPTDYSKDELTALLKV